MAGLVPGQRPGDVVQLRLIVREVRQRNAGQQIVDPLLQHSPHGPDAARSLRTTSLRIDGMEVAVDFEASEHVTFEVNCDLHPVDPQRCSPEASCSIRPVWRMLEQRINDLLASVSLADLMHEERELYQIAGVVAGNKTR